MVNVTYIGKNSFKKKHCENQSQENLQVFPHFPGFSQLPPWPLEMLFAWDVEGLYVTPSWRIIVTFAPSWNPTRCCQIWVPPQLKLHQEKKSRPKTNQWQWSLPIGSMYGIFTYIWLIFVVKETFWRCTVSISIPIKNSVFFSTVMLGFRGGVNMV